MNCSTCKRHRLIHAWTESIGLDDAAIWVCNGCHMDEYECNCKKEENKE